MAHRYFTIKKTKQNKTKQRKYRIGVVLKKKKLKDTWCSQYHLGEPWNATYVKILDLYTPAAG